jgi:hypothetical protein
MVIMSVKLLKRLGGLRIEFGVLQLLFSIYQFSSVLDIAEVSRQMGNRTGIGAEKEKEKKKEKKKEDRGHTS